MSFFKSISGHRPPSSAKSARGFANSSPNLAAFDQTSQTPARLGQHLARLWPPRPSLAAGARKELRKCFHVSFPSIGESTNKLGIVLRKKRARTSRRAWHASAPNPQRPRSPNGNRCAPLLRWATRGCIPLARPGASPRVWHGPKLEIAGKLSAICTLPRSVSPAAVVRGNGGAGGRCRPPWRRVVH